VHRREVKSDLNDALIYIRLHRSRNLATRNLKVRPAKAWDDTSALVLTNHLEAVPDRAFTASCDFVGSGLSDPGSHQPALPYMWIVSQ
jgi:hypothetical protein